MSMTQHTEPGPVGGGRDRRVAKSLGVRISAAQRMLKCCRMCELNCGVNRAAGERGVCGLDHRSYLYKSYLSGNEEHELLPALRLFLGGCNLRCSFCDEAPEAFDASCGDLVTVSNLAVELANAVESGVRTISVLGGEPTLHAHTLLELASQAPGHLPLAINSNMYMTPAVLDLLDGVVDWYLADFKFGNDDCAQRIANIPNYSSVVRRNLQAAANRAWVIIRHVLLPGHWECCFRPIVDWCAGNLPKQRFELYTGYVPCNVGDTALGRLNTPSEIATAEAYLRESGLRLAPTKRTDNPWQTRSAPASHGEVTVTLGVNGKLYCHDLPSEFAELLDGFQAPQKADANDGATRP